MIRFTDPTEHAEKLAERKATLLAKKAELEATLLESWHPAERKQLETTLGSLCMNSPKWSRNLARRAS